MSARPQPSLPVQPFLDALNNTPQHKRRPLVSNRTLYRKLERGRAKGRLTYTAADELAIYYLHKHPAEIWGPEAWSQHT